MEVVNDPRVRKLATSQLMAEFRGMRSPDLNGRERPTEAVGRQRRLKLYLAMTLEALAREEHFDELAALIRDPVHGDDRAYLVGALGHVKTDAAVELALEMFDDDEMDVWALRALANLHSERGWPIFEAIAARPKPRGRKLEDDIERTRIEVAQGGPDKLAKARAKGKSRP